MINFRGLLVLACLFTCIQTTNAQRFPLPTPLSDRVGNTIDKHERAYFGLFPWVEYFSNASVVQVSNTSYQIVIENEDRQQEVLTLDTPQFQALQYYIEDFEVRYTDSRGSSWDHITAYTSPIHQPFGPADTYEIILITGKKKYGKIVWADESGVYLSQNVSARYPSQTGSSMTFIPRGRLFRLKMQTPFLQSLQDKVDIIYAGEPHTYQTLTLPQLKTAALHPRSMPPELYEIATRKNLVPSQVQADPDWRIFRIPPQSSKVHTLLYFTPLNNFSPNTVNGTSTAVSEFTDLFPAPADTVLGNITTERPLLFGAVRFAVLPRLRLGVSVLQTVRTNLRQLPGSPILEPGSDVGLIPALRAESGTLKTGGTFVNLDLTYLLKAARDYVQVYPRKTRAMHSINIKLTAGPSIAFSRTEAQIRSGGAVFRGTVPISFNEYGETSTHRGIFPGVHAAVEVSIMLNGSWSAGLLFNSAAYFGYTVPTKTLNTSAGDATAKILRGPSDEMLWLSSFFLGFTYHF